MCVCPFVCYTQQRGDKPIFTREGQTFYVGGGGVYNHVNGEIRVGIKKNSGIFH